MERILLLLDEIDSWLVGAWLLWAGPRANPARAGLAAACLLLIA